MSSSLNCRPHAAVPPASEPAPVSHAAEPIEKVAAETSVEKPFETSSETPIETSVETRVATQVETPAAPAAQMRSTRR